MASRAAHPFEHATTHVVGGVAPDQVDLIFADLTAVQQMLSAADPQTSNLCDLHTHNIINQLIEGFASVHAANSPIATPTVPENDVSQPQPAQPPTVATPSQPAQPPTQTQTSDTAHDASPPPAETQPPTAAQPVNLTHSTTAIHSSHDGRSSRTWTSTSTTGTPSPLPTTTLSCAIGASIMPMETACRCRAPITSR